MTNKVGHGIVQGRQNKNKRILDVFLKWNISLWKEVVFEKTKTATTELGYYKQIKKNNPSLCKHAWM